MIPKIIHCVWLSGERKPNTYLKCIDSWKQIMPDYSIQEWSLASLPKELLEQTYVASAIKEHKWAYATDYIRLWALHTYGGIYLDMDVLVYKSFDPFLSHRAFSCVELYPEDFYQTLHKKEIIGLGIEAAVMGCEKGHPLMKDIMNYYKDLIFINSPQYYYNYIMPRVLTRVAHTKYNFRYIPTYQVLEQDIHIYPSDVFSSIYDFKKVLNTERNEKSIEALGNSPIRYAFHYCAHGWWDGDHRTKTLKWKIKHLIYLILGKKNPFKKKDLTNYAQTNRRN